MSLLKRVPEPEMDDLPQLVVKSKPLPAQANPLTPVSKQHKRPPTQKIGYFTSQFATLNLNYYKDQVYVPDGCEQGFDPPAPCKILDQSQVLQHIQPQKCSADELRRVLSLDREVRSSYSETIRQRACQPTERRFQYAAKLKEAQEKSAFFQVTQSKAQAAFKRDFLTVEDANLLQGGYKMPGKQLSASAPSFNRVNGRGVAAPSIAKLPVLFNNREGLYQAAVCAAVIKAVKLEVEEDARFFDNSAGKHQQFVTELKIEPEIGTTGNSSTVGQDMDSVSVKMNDAP